MTIPILQYRLFTTMRHTAIFTSLAVGLVAMFALSLPATRANAFCIENKAGQELLFIGRLKSDSLNKIFFKRLIKPGKPVCEKPDKGNARIEVFVFVDEDALEGCSAEVTATKTLILKSFHEFDNCGCSDG